MKYKKMHVIEWLTMAQIRDKSHHSKIDKVNSKIRDAEVAGSNPVASTTCCKAVNLREIKGWRFLFAITCKHF